MISTMKDEVSSSLTQVTRTCKEFHVLGLVILKFYMQAILDTDFHLDGIIDIRGHAIGVHPKFFILHDIR
jgi:hypothetical protein